MNDAQVFAHIFLGEGAIPMTWERGSRCSCWSDDTRQPEWGCAECGGFGVIYAPAQPVRGLFRSQSRWTSHRSSGEHSIGEAQLTLPIDVKPQWLDDRVRDRFTVTIASGDLEAGRVFYPAAQPIPFLFDGVQRAWRVQVQSADQATRLEPQP